jgi:hypothetical protein
MFDQVRAVLFDALNWLHLRTGKFDNLGRKVAVARDDHFAISSDYDEDRSNGGLSELAMPY